MIKNNNNTHKHTNVQPHTCDTLNTLIYPSYMMELTSGNKTCYKLYTIFRRMDRVVISNNIYNLFIYLLIDTLYIYNVILQCFFQESLRNAMLYILLIGQNRASLGVCWYGSLEYQPQSSEIGCLWQARI